MNRRLQPQSDDSGKAYGPTTVPDESAVLRLSRTALRAQPPAVRFIERPPMTRPQDLRRSA